MSDKHPLHLMLDGLKYESIEQILPPRLPFVDQCLDVVRLMKERNDSNEQIACVLSVTVDCLRMYSKPVFVVKETK